MNSKQQCHPETSLYQYSVVTTPAVEQEKGAPESGAASTAGGARKEASGEGEKKGDGGKPVTPLGSAMVSATMRMLFCRQLCVDVFSSFDVNAQGMGYKMVSVASPFGAKVLTSRSRLAGVRSECFIRRFKDAVPVMSSFRIVIICCMGVLSRRRRFGSL